MKICLLSGASSIHTIRWANGLSSAGHEVHVITQHPAIEPFNDGVVVHALPFRGVLGYFTLVPVVRKLLRRLQPDIVNAHYASGYATTARLVGRSPWLLSIWGSDVYDFPYKSPLHKWLVVKNLAAADAVASTSYCMADQARSLFPALTDIAITPFGVDLTAYDELPETKRMEGALENLVVGTVKTLDPKYGVDTLLKAFSLVLNGLRPENQALADNIQLRLVGSGSQIQYLRALSRQLGIEQQVEFVGRVPHQKVPAELSKLDIYVALSRLDSESFGVAIIEAGAAGKPVVVSDAGGLPEVTIQGKTGLVVPRENPQAAADAILTLILDTELRRKMGVAGKQHVRDNYNWSCCVSKMVDVYQRTIDSHAVK